MKKHAWSYFYSWGIDLHWVTKNMPTSFRIVLARPQKNSTSRMHGNCISFDSPLCLYPVSMYMELFMCTIKAIIEISSFYHFNEICPPESKLGCKVGSDNFWVSAVSSVTKKFPMYFFIPISKIVLCSVLIWFSIHYVFGKDKERRGFPISWNFCLICQKASNSRLSHRKIRIVTILKYSETAENIFLSFQSGFFQ